MRLAGGVVSVGQASEAPEPQRAPRTASRGRAGQRRAGRTDPLLQKLAGLRNRGILTDDELAAQKAGLVSA